MELFVIYDGNEKYLQFLAPPANGCYGSYDLNFTSHLYNAIVYEEEEEVINLINELCAKSLDANECNLQYFKLTGEVPEGKVY